MGCSPLFALLAARRLGRREHALGVDARIGLESLSLSGITCGGPLLPVKRGKLDNPPFCNWQRRRGYQVWSLVSSNEASGSRGIIINARRPLIPAACSPTRSSLSPGKAPTPGRHAVLVSDGGGRRALRALTSAYKFSRLSAVRSASAQTNKQLCLSATPNAICVLVYSPTATHRDSD